MSRRALRTPAVAALVTACVVIAACTSPDDVTPEAAPRTTIPDATTTTLATPTTLVHDTDESISAAPPGVQTITMTNYKFSPSTVRVQAGDVSLYLVNAAPAPGPEVQPDGFYDHFVDIKSVERDSIAKSARIVPGAAGLFHVEGLQPGSYEFICTIHYGPNGQMTGTIEVVP